MSNFQSFIDAIVQFRDERDWKQFHDIRNMLLSLNLEVAELAEHFQWVRDDNNISLDLEKKEAVGSELADILYWVLLISHDLGIDLGDAFWKKQEENKTKYPVEKVSGSSKKYTEYTD